MNTRTSGFAGPGVQSQRTTLLHLRRRPRAPWQICAAADPWKVLGVAAGATEKEIKRAHRQLVLKHHPDLAGDDVLAQARFLSIQEAYEIIVGKRRGKEPGARPANGWDFHDWYWQFGMKRRQGRAAAGAAPSGVSSETQRTQWRQQLSGLRQRAAAKRAPQPQQEPKQEPHPQERASATTASSSAWRSATKNSRIHQHTAQQAAAQAVRPLRASAAASEPAAEAPLAAHAAAPPPTEQPLSNAAEASHLEESPRAGDQVQDLLHSAVHAVHTMRDSHDAAVQAHAERVTSHIVAFGQRLRSRLHAHGLRELLHLDDDGGGFANAWGAAAGDARDHAHVQGSSGGGELRANFDEFVFAGVGPQSGAAGVGPGAAHSRKFADRHHVETRLTGQMAGLKRRAALKTEVHE